jgi:nitrogen-specific signal transduction histidine kinase
MALESEKLCSPYECNSEPDQDPRASEIHSTNTVEDNGGGLPGNVSTRVFDPFFTTKARGTGLGLSIANEIVRAHQGTLTLKSKPNGGTVASLVLPRFGEHQREAIASELGGASV